MDNEKEEEEEKELKPTFRIRLTISDNSNSDTKYCNQSSPSCRESIHRCNHQASNNEQRKKKPFKLIQPQNHKSSLFVNLSDITKSSNQKQVEHCLFVSPDLNQLDPSSLTDSTLCSRSSSIDLAQQFECANLLDNSSNTTGASLEDITMSQSCNFINSLMLASRRRSASVTPTEPPANKPDGRRASSSNNLAVQNHLTKKSSSNNHLDVAFSNETICDVDQTQTNSASSNKQYMQPLTVDVNGSPTDPNDYDSNYYLVPTSADIDQMGSHLEDECKVLEEQVRLWEQKVEELERQKFAPDVPTSLIDRMVELRKELRDLDTELFKLDLEEEMRHVVVGEKVFTDTQLSNYLSHKDARFCSPQEARFGSQIKPGQENTADILDAIPPSGSLQYRQYLSRASTGTDYSEYSQLPAFDQHRKHQVDRGRARNDSQSKSQVYVDFDVANHQIKLQGGNQRRSPIRPDHFNGEFRRNNVIAQDSSSTGSSESPY